ncbi:uncharacterized protein LOC112127762 [Cimex lectularius]|uniref:Retrotransposon gag domain-containing protein n=1 Tax=Cimex lectularius TaxID=79782 RepID=A0A8I6SNM2_CIMLE|nr:uncharacterized protein LOC112127762 [Cimex lectularius]
MDHLFPREDFSEVGSGSDLDRRPVAVSTSSQVPWKEILEEQNRMVSLFLQHLRKERDHFDLPEFNPELADSDPKVWCTAVNVLMDENPLSGRPLLVALTKALKGSAAQWLNQVTDKKLTWQKFKELFLIQYDVAETPTAIIINLLETQPSNGDFVAYATKMLTSLSTKWQDMTKDKIAMSLILAHMARSNERFRRLAYTLELKSKESFLKEIKAATPTNKRLYPFSTPSTSAYEGAKIARRMFPKCVHRGLTNHQSSECRRQHHGRTDQGLDRNLRCERCGTTLSLTVAGSIPALSTGVFSVGGFKPPHYVKVEIHQGGLFEINFCVILI